MRGKKFMKTAAIMAALTLTAGMTSGLAQYQFTSAPFTACADDEYDNDFTEGSIGAVKYFKYSDHITICGCDMSATSLEIPGTIDGMTVTAIEPYAFSGVGLTSVTIPDTVTYIGTWAFGMCSSLTSITIPDSVTTIDVKAFEDCTSLKTINFPDKQLVIYDRVFDGTPWLEAMRAKDPLVVINGSLVDGATAKGDVVIPSDVTFISSSAFAENENITSVVIPSGVKEILDSTFAGCTKLKSADIQGAETIYYDAFGRCASLNELKLAGTLKSVNDYAFSECTPGATITYYGSEDDWKKVTILDDNQVFNNAKMIYAGAKESVKGDINADGAFNVADAVTLQKWLLNDSSANVKDWKAGDLCADGKLNVFDLTAMREALSK